MNLTDSLCRIILGLIIVYLNIYGTYGFNKFTWVHDNSYFVLFIAFNINSKYLKIFVIFLYCTIIFYRLDNFICAVNKFNFYHLLTPMSIVNKLATNTKIIKIAICKPNLSFFVSIVSCDMAYKNRIMHNISNPITQMLKNLTILFLPDNPF